MDIKVRLALTEEMLGTCPADPELYEKYIVGKLEKNGQTPVPEATEEEIESLPDVADMVEKGTTVFHRLEDGPCVFDYVIKGFLKGAMEALRRVKKTDVPAAYKKVIDQTIFVMPRQIPIVLPEGGEMGFCERPLRADTAQGPRVSLARSETVPVGSTLEFTVTLLQESVAECVEQCWDYGKYLGIGQWRTSGKGRFTYEILDA